MRCFILLAVLPSFTLSSLCESWYDVMLQEKVKNVNISTNHGNHTYADRRFPVNGVRLSRSRKGHKRVFFGIIGSCVRAHLLYIGRVRTYVELSARVRENRKFNTYTETCPNMNLYTRGNGLFGTHVTWEDIEEDMQRELDTLAIFGPNKTAKNVGDGRGFMSKIALIQPDWQYKDKDLPENFVVKIVSQLSMIEITEEMSRKNNTKNIFDSDQMRMAIEQQQKRTHNAEVTVYKHLMKHPGRVPTTKIYYMKKFSKYNPVKGYIIMEYVENIIPLHIYENVPPKSLSKVLRAKAALEAISLCFTEDEKNEFTHRPFAEFFGPIFTKETVETMIDGMRSLGTDEILQKLEKMREVLMDFMNFEWADQLADELGMQRVLCHGDLWSTNMLWKQNGDDVNMAAMIDFQTAHMGCPANDLIRLFCACLSGKDRQEHWEHLVEEFYSYLKEEVDDKPMPYTLEQLKEACRRFMPLGTFMIVTMIAPMCEALYHNPDEQHKKGTTNLVNEKMECLLDDLLKYHERNTMSKNDNSV